MRIMGLDFGSKTVGVAISDALLVTAQGIEIIRRKEENKLRQTLARIEEMIVEYEVEEIVLGLPKNMNATEGIRAELTMEFKEKLERRTGLPVHMWDERLTTVAADKTMMEAFFEKEGTRIVCGGTTNRITARYLGNPLEATLDYADSDLPPIYRLEGVDLSTEGVVTISKVLEYADEYLSGTQLQPSWEGHRDGAARIAYELFERATDVNFFVGCAMNPAHQNPKFSLAFGAKFQLIERLSKSLERMGKHVSVRYY